MITILFGTIIMVAALAALTVAIKMRDKSLSTDTCENSKSGENHATCANCTCGKIFDKKKKLAAREAAAK